MTTNVDAKRASSRQQRRTDHTRGRLLDAALSVMMDRGYDATALSEVTERADLGSGTLYLHFRDKRSLYEGVVRRELDRIFRRWQEREATSPSPNAGEAVKRMLELTIEALNREPRKAHLLLVEGPAMETWLPDHVGAGLAAVIGGPMPDLTARLVIGAMAAACRFALEHPPAKWETLGGPATSFCLAGIAEIATESNARKKQPKPRSKASK